MISNSVTHMRSYTNTTIGGNTVRVPISAHRAQISARQAPMLPRRAPMLPSRAQMSPHQAQISSHQIESVLTVFHDVLLVVHNVLRVFHASMDFFFMMNRTSLTYLHGKWPMSLCADFFNLSIVSSIYVVFQTNVI